MSTSLHRKPMISPRLHPVTLVFDEHHILFNLRDEPQRVEVHRRDDLDLSQYDAAPLMAFTATKEMDYGTETDGRIPQGRGADRVEQWAEAQAGG